MRRARAECRVDFRSTLTRATARSPGALPDPNAIPVDRSCSSTSRASRVHPGCCYASIASSADLHSRGNLQRPDGVGSDLLEITRFNFRQKLARARRDLHNFMQPRCGLGTPRTHVVCAKKTQSFMTGLRQPPEPAVCERAVAARTARCLRSVRDAIDTRCGVREHHRDHPFTDRLTLSRRSVTLIRQPRYGTLFGGGIAHGAAVDPYNHLARAAVGWTAGASWSLCCWRVRRGAVSARRRRHRLRGGWRYQAALRGTR